jgi:hypothetical protein
VTGKKSPSLADSHLGMESLHTVLGTEPANFRGLGPQSSEETTVICPPCREREHARCEDRQRGDSARYSSCHCQHKGEVKAEPATGPAGE